MYYINTAIYYLLSYQIEWRDVIAVFFPCRFEPFPLLGQNLEQLRRRIDNVLVMELFHSLHLGKILCNADCKLIDIVLLSVVLFENFLEQFFEVLIAWNMSGWCFYTAGFAVHTQFHPLYPDVLVADAIDELAFFVPQEIIYAKHQRRFSEFFAEFEVISNILAQRNSYEILYTHQIGL